MNLRTTILFLFCCLLYGSSVAQTSFCNSSKIIPLECRKKVYGSNQNSGNTLVHPDYKNCVSGVNAFSNPYNGNDVIYQVNVDDSNLRILLEDLTADLDLFLFKDCSAQRSCFYRSLNSGNNDEVIQIPLANGTYYLVIDGFDTSQKSNFALTVICRQGDDPDNTPDCDALACTDAYDIHCDQAVTSTTVGKPSRLNKECNYGTHCTNNYADYSAGDRVFRVQVPSGKDKMKITLSHFQKNLDLFVFKNGCQLNRCVAASQRTSTNNEYITIDNPSGYYYIVVDGNSDNDESTFKLTVECEEEQSFSCSTAEELQCNKVYEGSNRYGYNNLTHADYGSCANYLNASHYPYTGKDLVYKIYVEEGQSLNVYLTDLHANLDMFLYRFCAGYVGGLNGCVARSVKDGKWAEHISEDNLQAGYYYLVIDGRNSYQESSFKLRIDCNEPCDPVIEDDCDDLRFSYVGNGDELLYKFEVPSSYGSGKWTITNTSNNAVQTFEGSRSVRFDFSHSGKYKICYTYKDYSGCEHKCCKTVYIKSPNDCDDITVEDRGDKIALSALSNTYRAVHWRNVSTGTSLGGSQVLLIDAPQPGRCYVIEALLYDRSRNAYRYCRVKVCKEDDTNDLQWLDDLIANLELCCEENDNIQVEVQRGKLNGETVYLVPDCATADGFLTVYDESGDVICREGGFAGLVCEEIEDITNRSTIFSCGDDNNDCVSISDQSIDCDEDGIISYTFKVRNNTGGADVLLEFGVSSESEVKFENCSIRNTFLLEGEEEMITLKLKNCGDEDLEDGTPVAISVKVKDGDTVVCEGEEVTVGVSECDSCAGDPIEDIFCTEEFDPVCGCDGVTYSNPCYAIAAGINTWVKGACDANTGEGADLSLTISTDVARFSIFQKVPFSVTVTNDGPETARNVEVSVPLPTATAYSLSTPSVGNYRVVAQTWDVGNLEAGESATLEFVVFTLSANDDLTLYAQVSASDTFDPDSTPGNGDADNLNEDDEASATVAPNNTANATENDAAQSFGLNNFPNPFTQSTTIQFVLADQEAATLTVFDINGRNLFEVNRTFEKGLNQIEFNDTRQLSEGVYFYRLQTASTTITKSMILTK